MCCGERGEDMEKVRDEVRKGGGEGGGERRGDGISETKEIRRRHE